MTDQPILVERRAGYRVITLNRPGKLNAFNDAMHAALREAVDATEADADCRALMITGAGRAFCAGQDLADRLLKPGEQPVPRTSLERYYNPLVRKLRALPFPVVAAVNGVAAGAGCNVALACDIVIASLKASFIQSFARVGLIPDSGGTWFLPRLVGDARARGLALLAQELPAEKAANWGLIWRAVDDEVLMHEAHRICEHFADGADARPGADQARAQRLARQFARRPARSRARPAARGEPDARLRRGRARLHGKAQTELHGPQIMTRARVRALRSVEIGVADPQAALRFFTAVWNLGYVGEIDGAHYLRATGAFHHVLAIRRAAAPCTACAWCSTPPTATTVDALHRQVVAHGLQNGRSARRLRQPHGAYGFGFKDPEGRNTAVVCGVADHGDAPTSPTARASCRTSTSMPATARPTFRCYRDALGFRLTDTTQRLRFLSCNADHHSMVLGFTGGPTLNHIAFEVPDLESVMRGAGRMRDDGRGIEWGPGRHGPGNNVFCYFLGPEEFPIELTAEMQQVDEGHRAGTPEQLEMAAGPARSLGHQRRAERAHGGGRPAHPFHRRRLAARRLALVFLFLPLRGR